MPPEPDLGLTPGLTAQVTLTVTDLDTAQALGSGDVPVLGTPRVLALAEAATVAAIARRMPSGATTVGSRAELEHRAATAVGRTVAAHAELTSAEGSRLVFAVAVTEGDRIVARGTIERVVVDRHLFVERALRP